MRHFVPGRDNREKVKNHVLDKRNSPVSDSPRLCRTMVRRSGALAWPAPVNHPSRTTVAGPSMRAVPFAYHVPRTVDLYCQVNDEMFVSSVARFAELP